MRTQDPRPTLHPGAGLFFAALAALAGCRDRPPPAATAPGASWCAGGARALDDDLCVFVPDRVASPPALVFFLHGALAPDAIPREDMAAVIEVAEERGFVAAFPRGTQGLCAWKPEVSAHYCWPTKRETMDGSAPAIVDRWARAQERIEALVSARFGRRYVLGFSNGGYFAAYLGLEGLFPVDGVGVVGAGRTAVDESRTGPDRPPFYLAVGDNEAPFTQSDAENLASLLSLREWPVEYVIHPGRGHEIHADDVDAAWITWQSASRSRIDDR